MKLGQLVGLTNDPEGLQVAMITNMARYIDDLETQIELLEAELQKPNTILELIKGRMELDKTSKGEDAVYFSGVYPHDRDYKTILEWAKKVKEEEENEQSL